MPEEEYEMLDDNNDFEQVSDNLSPNNKRENNSLKDKLTSNKGRITNNNSNLSKEEKNLDDNKKLSDSDSKIKNKKGGLKDKLKNKDTAEKNIENAKGKSRGLRRGLPTLNNASGDGTDNKEEKNDNDSEGTNNNGENGKKDINPVNKVKNKIENAKNIASNPAELIKTVAKKVTKTVVKLVMTILSPFIIGILLAIFVIYLILGPLMEVWNAIDEGATYVANSVEKFTNFYKGFGFQDSKAAFFDEVNELQTEYYDNQLNLPLLMSTIFYTEQDGYDTEYEGVEEPESDDPISALATGGVTNLVSFFRTWTKDKIAESHNTVDENGLTYNAGKIYRLRRLAAAMCDRSGPSTSMGLGEFADKYGGMFAKAIKDVFSSLLDFIGTLIQSTFELVLSDIIDIVTFNWDNLGNNTEDFVNSIKDSGKNVIDCLGMLLNVVSFGLCTIKTMSIDVTELASLDLNKIITVKYVPYRVNIEKYDAYLQDYYIKNTPEFKQYLTGNEENDEKRIAQIIENIHANEKAFREIVLNEVEGSSEVYADGCVGAIDNNIINSLKSPVDVSSSKLIYFDSSSAFGVVDGLNHNGVDLNNENAGILAGDNIYAIADGKIESIGPSQGSVSNGNIDNYLFIGDSRYAAINSKLKNYGNNVIVYGEKDSSPNDWQGIAKIGSGTINNTQITLPSTATNISIMLGISDLSQDSQYRVLLNNLHDRYPSAKIYVNSVYHIGKNYSGHAKVSSIDEFNEKMKKICDSLDYAEYVDVTGNLYESSGYLNSTLTPDGFNLNGTGQDILVGNIVNAITGNVSIEDGGYTIKILHNSMIGDKTYKFYSVYGNVDMSSITIKESDAVSKGDVIGKIGKTNAGVSQLHFEFRNESDTPIDPTNLFIACSVPNTNTAGGNFAAHSTTLTKESFVNSWKSYCNSNSCNSYFVDHIGEIYDYSIKYKINPEFVVTRAMSEGYDPGGSTYNYWGIGCTNSGGGDDCYSFSSLQEGIRGLASLGIVEDAVTVADIMGSYAYIGAYWYNPGSWSTGGCAYFPYINKYMSTSRTSVVGNACISGKFCDIDGNGQCTKTIQEDQDAYAKWQVDDKMGVYRKAIWGLEN